ncbi:MAG TPA: DNA internalization-related competence protein ComEC/Rec2 [Candidatus Binataceae bacterium]|nr:DNA internalization-related competence protein ComEC/Rec2 [Candidatus Binataceae bacterium]
MLGDGAGNSRIFFPLWSAVTVAILAALAFVGKRRAAGLVLALVALAASATMAVRPVLAPLAGPATLKRFTDDSRVTVAGYLSRTPERVAGERHLQYLDLQVERAAADPSAFAPTSGRVRITAPDDEIFHVGDELRVTSRIRFPRNDGNPGEFDYRGWLLRQGIGATMYAEPRRNDPEPIQVIGHRSFPIATTLEAIREHIGGFIDANLEYPENAEMRALVIGDRSGIRDDLRQRFALTGMAHLLVISGLHLGFVATATFFLTRLLMGFSPALMARGYANKIAAAAAAIAVCVYASIAGHHVSTMRALVMVLSYAFAIMLDRSRELVSSLALAALIILLALPASTADIGFQLSFASVFVILLGMRRFTAWWRWRYMNPLAPRRDRSRLNLVGEVVTGYIAVSFWALIGTAPLTAFYFNQFSLIGLIANAVVVPIMGFGGVVFGLLAAAMSFISMPVARELLWMAGRLAEAGTLLAGWFEAWPLGWARIFTPTSLEVIITYAFILLWLTAPLKGAEVLRQLRQSNIAVAAKVQDPPRWRIAIALIFTFALIVDAGWWIDQRFFNRDLRITFLSVGEGDAAVVRFPGSRVMLIDGGGAVRSSFDPGERIVAPFLWSQKIMHVDYVTLSHPDRDHFGGLLFIAHNFSPAEFWTSVTDSLDDTELLNVMRAAGALNRVCNSASTPLIIGGADVRCLGPLANHAELKRNDSSMVLQLKYGPTVVLFPGDLESKGEHQLIASGADLRATILKVPHHGSRTSSSAAWLAAVYPELAVISLAAHNRFHFPASEVLDRYRAADITVLRTDEDGAISVDASAAALHVSSLRGGIVPLPATHH